MGTLIDKLLEAQQGQPPTPRHTRVGEVRMTFLSLVPGKGGPQALQGSLAPAPQSWANRATHCHWPWRSCQTRTALTDPWAPQGGRSGRRAPRPGIVRQRRQADPEAACQIRTPRGASS